MFLAFLVEGSSVVVLVAVVEVPDSGPDLVVLQEKERSSKNKK